MWSDCIWSLFLAVCVVWLYLEPLPGCLCGLTVFGAPTWLFVWSDCIWSLYLPVCGQTVFGASTCLFVVRLYLEPLPGCLCGLMVFGASTCLPVWSSFGVPPTRAALSSVIVVARLIIPWMWAMCAENHSSSCPGSQSFGLNIMFYFITHWKWMEQGKLQQRSFQVTTHMHAHSYRLPLEKIRRVKSHAHSSLSYTFTQPKTRNTWFKRFYWYPNK